MPVLLEEASNGIMPDFEYQTLEATGPHPKGTAPKGRKVPLRVSRTFMLILTGKDLQRFEHLANGYIGGPAALCQAIFSDYLAPDHWLSPEHHDVGKAHQEDELAGRLPI